jgi:hypothetical protein
MLTKKQARELRAELAREYKRKVRVRLAELREELRAARLDRRGALVRAKVACREGRGALRVRLKALRLERLAELRLEVANMKAEARASCQRGKRAPGERVTRARKELFDERRYQRELRRIEGHNRARSAEIRGASAKERRGESDDEVRGNIDPSLVPLFERVKRGIKATDRMSRTEAFLRYAEEHPKELLAALDDKSDRVIAELEERERMGRACLRSKATYAEVPF